MSRTERGLVAWILLVWMVFSSCSLSPLNNSELTAQPKVISQTSQNSNIQTSSATQVSHSATPQSSHSEQIQKWCQELESSVSQLKWKVNPCSGIRWQWGGTSVQGRPLVYAEFGDLQSENTTLIFSTVHGDEITPLYLGIQLAHWLKERESQFVKMRVVIAPLVNPDGFFKLPRTRMNARGVDVNRNFATGDWKNNALKAWKVRFRSDPRRFPGPEPRSEPETLFQEELIKKVRPHKILSIHSPLNFLDYDGPSALTLSRFPKDYTRECERLKKKLNAISGRFYPGSLGNYAGRELGIPTLTLELPSADPRYAEKYWNNSSQGIRTMIHFNVPNFATRQLEWTQPGG